MLLYNYDVYIGISLEYAMFVWSPSYCCCPEMLQLMRKKFLLFVLSNLALDPNVILLHVRIG